jgi:hypothetical protein
VRVVDQRHETLSAVDRLEPSRHLRVGQPGRRLLGRAFASKYSSIDGWKSRWSRDRFVKPATANRTPSTRPSASAWLDTSITTVSTCCSIIDASNACSAGASGVVSALGWSVPSMRMPTVPISPACRPAARSPASTR